MATDIHAPLSGAAPRPPSSHDLAVAAESQADADRRHEQRRAQDRDREIGGFVGEMSRTTRTFYHLGFAGLVAIAFMGQQYASQQQQAAVQAQNQQQTAELLKEVIASGKAAEQRSVESRSEFRDELKEVRVEQRLQREEATRAIAAMQQATVALTRAGESISAGARAVERAAEAVPKGAR